MSIVGVAYPAGTCGYTQPQNVVLFWSGYGCRAKRCRRSLHKRCGAEGFDGWPQCGETPRWSSGEDAVRAAIRALSEEPPLMARSRYTEERLDCLTPKPDQLGPSTRRSPVCRTLVASALIHKLCHHHVTTASWGWGIFKISDSKKFGEVVGADGIVLDVAHTRGGGWGVTPSGETRMPYPAGRDGERKSIGPVSREGRMSIAA